MTEYIDHGDNRGPWPLGEAALETERQMIERGIRYKGEPGWMGHDDVIGPVGAGWRKVDLDGRGADRMFGEDYR